MFDPKHLDTLVLFVMLRLIPGDPASVMLGERATDEAVARLNHELGLDQPIYIQYIYFVRQLVTFNLGTSIKYQIPVAQLLGPRLLISLSVVGVTLVLTCIIALPLGILAALKKDSLILLALAGIALLASLLRLAGMRGLLFATGSQITLLGVLAFADVFFRILWRPGAGGEHFVSLSLHWGIFLALLSAAAIAGGLIVSQILTLYTTPAVYVSLDNLRVRIQGRHP